MELTPEEKTTLETYNVIAEGWAQEHSGGDFWRKELNIFKELLPTGRVLEIGSGGGRDAKELIALGYDYTGTDISSRFLEIAKRENPTGSFFLQSVYDLSFPGIQFDGFWVAAVLLHIPKKNIDSALQKIRAVVKNGGIGFIAIKKGDGERMESDKRFFAYYLEDEFAHILQKNNFEIIQMSVHPSSERTIWLWFFVCVIK